jgi:hypothetical protein
MDFSKMAGQEMTAFCKDERSVSVKAFETSLFFSEYPILTPIRLRSEQRRTFEAH